MVILDQSPIWVVYLVTVVAALVAAEIGFRIGMWLQRRDPDSVSWPKTPIRSTSSASVGIALSGESPKRESMRDFVHLRTA
jgi:hypothetical protein